MPGKSRYLIITIVSSFMLMGCYELKHVTEFTETSIEALQSYETLPQSFNQICKEDCQLKHVAKFNIHSTQCDCSPEVKADSITNIIYSTSLEYLNGLLAVSDKQLAKYQTADLTTTLSTGNYGSLKLNENDVKAYSTLSSLLLRTFSGINQRKKIKSYVIDGYQPFQQLLTFLELNVHGNIYGKLEVQKQSIKNFYFDHVNNKNLSTYERTKFAEDYFNALNNIEAQQKELDVFSEILLEIKAGHTLLYEHVEGLKNDEVKSGLARLGSRLSLAVRIISNLN
ncbi:hypothetical protein ACFSSG_09050 [Euzebyella marina]|nr:hypothetical protein [Euzebyella marina]